MEIALTGDAAAVKVEKNVASNVLKIIFIVYWGYIVRIQFPRGIKVEKTMSIFLYFGASSLS
jgi:hypothetical protein